MLSLYQEDIERQNAISEDTLYLGINLILFVLLIIFS
jgi:hypothetical protein